MKGKTVIQAWLTLVLLVAGPGYALAACPLWTSEGIPPGAASLIGARFTSFPSTNPDDQTELFLGPVPLPAIEPAAVLWGDQSAITVTYDPITVPATLTAAIGPPGGAPTTTVVYAFGTSVAGTLGFVQLSIVSAGAGESASFSGVTLVSAGETCVLGDMGGSGTFQELILRDVTAGFTLTGLLTLGGSRSEGQFLEIVAGTLNEAPDCTAAYASPARLWPPNHKYRSISLLGVTDPEGDPVTVTIDSIFQDEPVNGASDGNTAPDGQGVGTSAARVRAERAAGADGRFYHIGFTATDSGGASCTGEVLVTVPKSKGNPWWQNPVDGGALYDSTVVPP